MLQNLIFSNWDCTFHLATSHIYSIVFCHVFLKIIKIYIKFNKFLMSSKPVNTLVFYSLAPRCAIKLRLDKSIVYIFQEVNLKIILAISKLQLSQITSHLSVSPAICLKICRLIYLHCL